MTVHIQTMACGISCGPLWRTLSDVNDTNETSRVNHNNYVSLKPKVFKPVVLYQNPNSSLDELKPSLKLSPTDNNCKKRKQTIPTDIFDIRNNEKDGLNDDVHLLQNNYGNVIKYKCDACEASSVCSVPECGVSSFNTMHTNSLNLCEIRPFLEAGVLQLTSNSLERQSIGRSDNRQLPHVSFPFAAQQLAKQTESSLNPYNVFSDFKSFPQDIRNLHSVILDLHRPPSTLRPEIKGCFHSSLDVSSNQNYIASNFTCDTLQSSRSYLDSLGPQWGNWQFLNLLPVSCSMASATQHGQCHSSVIAGDKDNIHSESETLTKTKRLYNGETTCSYASINISDSRLYQAERQLENVGIGSPSKKRNVDINTGNRPYSCQCGRAFTRNEELTRHQRIHSGYKPHQCHICCKLFGRKDHLNKHLKTHLHSSEKKVHVCNIPNCGQSYTRSDALARHQMNSHGIRARPYQWRPRKKE